MGDSADRTSRVTPFLQAVAVESMGARESDEASNRRIESLETNGTRRELKFRRLGYSSEEIR